jgi:hypothetical protein
VIWLHGATSTEVFLARAAPHSVRSQVVGSFGLYHFPVLILLLIVWLAFLHFQPLSARALPDVGIPCDYVGHLLRLDLLFLL